MAEITREELLDPNALQEKLEANNKEITDLRESHNEVIKKQAELLQSKILKFKPIMEYLKNQGAWFSHPTLDGRSARGAILDYDSKEDELYVYEVESDWIKAIKMYDTKQVRSLVAWSFVETRNLENAINGLNYLLHIQDVHIENLRKNISKREQWISENE